MLGKPPGRTGPRVGADATGVAMTVNFTASVRTSSLEGAPYAWDVRLMACMIFETPGICGRSHRRFPRPCPGTNILQRDADLPTAS